MNGTVSDVELLRAYALHGSESAFCQLVSRHLDLVYGTALRQLGDRGLAEEVTQNVFIALARKARGLSGTALAAWLYGATVCEARRQLRGELRRRQREATAAALGSTMQDDPSLLASLTPLLDDALLELREADRQALLLRYLQARSLRDVGMALGVTDDTAQKRVAKALEALTRVFRRRGYAVSAVTAASVVKAVALTAPAGLATTVSQAALAAGGTASVGGAALFFGKLMSLTKSQTAALCALLMGAPAVYEWNVLSGARADTQLLERQLAEERRSLAARQNDLVAAEARFRRTEREVGVLQWEAGKARARLARAATNYYVWDANSRFVRLPKAVLDDVRLRDGQSKGQRTLYDDGGLAEPLRQALGLSEAEAGQVRESYQEFSRQFAGLVAANTMETNRPPSGLYRLDLPNSRTLYCSAFSESGAALRKALCEQWNATLGPDRSQALWSQVQSDMEEARSEFGALEKFETVYWGTNSQAGFGYAYRGTNGSVSGGAWTERPESLPAHLRRLLPEPMQPVAPPATSPP